MLQFVALGLAITLPGDVNESSDWNQWRGPNRNGQISGTLGWPSSLDDTRLKREWRISLGSSYSGPIVVGSRVFVTGTRNKSHEVVRALDRTSGKELWKVEWKGALRVPFFARANGSWIRSTPASDGKRLFVAGIRDVLVCLDVASGKQLWRVDFAKKYRSPLPGFGTVCSPLIDGKAVYIQAAGSVVKLDAATGKVAWRSGEENGGGLFGRGLETSAFSSPVIRTLAGKRQLIVQGRKALGGIDLATGKPLWSKAVPAFRGMNIQTPLVIGNSVFTSSYGGGTFLFDVSARDGDFKVNQRWKTTQQGYMSSPVAINGNVFLHLRNQRFTCINADTGKSNWTTRPFGKYWSMAVNGRRILALDQRGDLLLIDATPEGFRRVSSRRVSDSSTWAHLAVSGTQVFIRELNAIAAYSWK